MKDTGGSAFPRPHTDSELMAQAQAGQHSNGAWVSGMTLKDYAVIKFMQSQIVYEGMEGCDKELMVACAHELADTMLKARK